MAHPPPLPITEALHPTPPVPGHPLPGTSQPPMTFPLYPVTSQTWRCLPSLNTQYLGGMTLERGLSPRSLFAGLWLLS